MIPYVKLATEYAQQCKYSEEELEMCLQDEGLDWDEQIEEDQDIPAFQSSQTGVRKAIEPSFDNKVEPPAPLTPATKKPASTPSSSSSNSKGRVRSKSTPEVKTPAVQEEKRRSTRKKGK